jgi:predicted deacylase
LDDLEPPPSGKKSGVAPSKRAAAAEDPLAIERQRADLRIGGERIALGETRDLAIQVSQQYSGEAITVPLRVWRAPDPGPTVFVTAAIHGDEINGTGIVRGLLIDPPLDLVRGSLILVPVVNVLGFERDSRYLPDRRDLNRSFPGSASGSMAARFAHAIFSEIVAQSDWGIDLHAAAVRRTNFPNVRADLSRPAVKRLALAFGGELVINGKGPPGALRREATKAGCPTIILEAGEVWKIEPSMVEVGLRGLRNALIELGMVKGEALRPVYQAIVNRTTWLRAEHAGMLRYHVAPGELVERRQALATVTDLLGHPRHVMLSPRSGIVLGMTTLPVVKPGEPVYHLAIPEGGLRRIRKALNRAVDGSLSERLRQDLATNVTLRAVDEGSN